MIPFGGVNSPVVLGLWTLECPWEEKFCLPLWSAGDTPQMSSWQWKVSTCISVRILEEPRPSTKPFWWGGGGPWSVWSQSLEDKKPDDKKLKVKVPRKHCERQLVHRCFLGKEVKGEVLGEWKGESNWDAASVDPGGALSWLFSEVQGGDDRTGSLCPTLTSDRMEAFPGRSYLGRGRSL